MAAAPPDDLLHTLPEARYEDSGEPMSENQLLDELNILLVAGHETPANTLAWAFYLLARHPTARARLVADIEHKLPGGRPPELDDLLRLPYALGVVQKTLHLYLPAWIMDHVALEADEFQGQLIAAGTLFSLYLYGLHHPGLWPSPEAFQPERFAPGAAPALPAYGYLPFGGGPRLYVGNHFALTELQLVLIQVVRHYQVSLVEGARPLLHPLVMLRPAGGLSLRFERRAAPNGGLV